MSLASRVAITLAGVAFVVAGWLDNGVIRGLRERPRPGRLNETLALLASSIGQRAVAGAVLLLAAVAWRSRSLFVGWVYTIVGAVVLSIPVTT